MKKLGTILLLLAFFAMPATAQTITLIDPGITEGHSSNVELLVYYGNGTYAGVVDTNNSLTIDGSDIVIHHRASSLDVFEDPVGFLTIAVEKFSLVIILIVAGVFFAVGMIGVAWKIGTGSGKKRRK